MPTPLTKPLVREIGDLVVELGEAGLRIRRKRGRVWGRMAWCELGDLVPAASRKLAFQSPLPPRWCPSPGEWVWLSRECELGRSIACGQVVSVYGLSGLVKVRGPRAGKWPAATIELAHCRPAARPIAWPEERLAVETRPEAGT